MGKSIRKKIARFELEPDGFSIHTFELSCQIKGKCYHKIKSYPSAALTSLAVITVPGSKSFSTIWPFSSVT